MAIRQAEMDAIGEPTRRTHRSPAIDVAVARDGPRDESVRLADKRIGVSAVWQETCSTFCGHAPLILSLALIGFAAPMIVCLALSAALKISAYPHVSGPFATWEGINALRSGSGVLIALLCLQAVFGAIGLAYARGVIARLALSNAKDTPSLGLACREAKAHFSSLLLGSLIYSTLLAGGAIGINAALRDTDFDLSDIGQPAMTIRDHAKVLALRTLDAFVPSPGSPFAEFVPVARYAAFEQFTQVTFYERQLAELHGEEKVFSRTRSVNLWLIALASTLLVVAAETLMRFTPVMAMNSCGPRLSVITPVLHSMWFGVHHFGMIMKHVWLLRLAFVVGYGTFFALPVVLSQAVLPPFAPFTMKQAMQNSPVSLTLMCYWLVMALFVAFSTVYDARLYLALHSLYNSRPCARMYE